MKHEYSPATWDIFPLAQIIAHDKCSFVHHDLGQFVTNRETLAWTLALGYGLSYRIAASALDRDGPREWLRWLDRLQKSVVARYVGKPMKLFVHERGAQPPRDDDGIIRATYGPVEIIANLGSSPKAVASRNGTAALPGFGFRATAPGVVAANLQIAGGVDGRTSTTGGGEGELFVAEGNAHRADVWVYAVPASDVAVELPAHMTGKLTLALDGEPVAPVRATCNIIRFRLPQRSNSDATRFLWHATVTAR